MNSLNGHLRFNTLLCALLALTLTAMSVSTGATAQNQGSTLPTIGGTGGGLIAGQQEADIGRQVLVSLRRFAPQITDPLVYDYLSAILYRLVPAAPLQNRDLTLALIDDPAINAFAVPGGIVGVNGGLFLFARTEQQFASVLAHELAHLSQRHFARRLEQQQTSTPLTIAGLIAGIVLTAVTQSDIGIAAIVGTQALAIQNMLEYSRANEQEADRVGLDILANAGLDPRGMPEMFEIMTRQNRLQGNRVPEYLSTHPLTQSRVADTQNRAEQYPLKHIDDSPEYHLIRARLQVHYAVSAAAAIDSFRAALNESKNAGSSNSLGSNASNTAIRYGLAVAYIKDGQYPEAETLLNQLLLANPGRITFQVTLARSLIAARRLTEARALLVRALARNPGNYPITHTLAQLELASDNGAAAAELLSQLARNKPQQEHLWFQLAEAEGMARNIVGVHRARAEYDALMGDLESAQRQLRQAQEKLTAGSPMRQIVTERLSAITAELNVRRNG
ncbi:M48 family metalloprotease [Marinobacter sp. BSs20148]|jgi:predicted Zn-dependent protease|uniref:M48 family metalloprotease n=1 Tax=Marinobacter sp. BSs20148 TaxID=490759 RepID=UPI000277752E|nr:M48 family metalloprotease [Marinobacter sp. BSs20148]AFP31242.1 peptidase M48, Ste24p [Marinobacter sp. BSs20148]